MKVKCTVMFLTIFLLSKTLVLAQETSLDFYQKCQAFIDDLNGKKITAEQSMGNIWLLGYVAGIVDFHSICQTNCNVCQYDYCLPENGIPSEEIIKCVYTYVRKKPEAVKLSPRMLMLAALMGSYPCKEK